MYKYYKSKKRKMSHTRIQVKNRSKEILKRNGIILYTNTFIHKYKKKKNTKKSK